VKADNIKVVHHRSSGQKWTQRAAIIAIAVGIILILTAAVFLILASHGIGFAAIGVIVGPGTIGFFAGGGSLFVAGAITWGVVERKHRKEMRQHYHQWYDAPVRGLIEGDMAGHNRTMQLVLPVDKRPQWVKELSSTTELPKAGFWIVGHKEEGTDKSVYDIYQKENKATKRFASFSDKSSVNYNENNNSTMPPVYVLQNHSEEHTNEVEDQERLEQPPRKPITQRIGELISNFNHRREAKRRAAEEKNFYARANAQLKNFDSENS
jgi:hypothetical protein